MTHDRNSFTSQTQWPWIQLDFSFHCCEFASVYVMEICAFMCDSDYYILFFFCSGEKYKNGKLDYSSKGWNRRTKGFPSPENSSWDVNSSQVMQNIFIVKCRALYPPNGFQRVCETKPGGLTFTLFFYSDGNYPLLLKLLYSSLMFYCF